MSERKIALAHTTILRWVRRYVPEFEKLWKRYARPVGGSWRCDKTYVNVKDGWTHLYRAVDKKGRTVDFLFSEKRDVAAAKRFFSLIGGPSSVLTKCGKSLKTVDATLPLSRTNR